MSNEKLKEMKLTKRAKYGLGGIALVAILSFGVVSVVNIKNDEDITNNNQPVIAPSEGDDDKDNSLVVVENEKLAKPFSVDASIKTYYFDANDNSETQENALIYYNGMFTPSYALDYFYNNNAFDVLASFSGEVIEKKVDPLYGATVYIKSSDNSNLVAVYASLSDINVNVGDKVTQGQKIAKAGNNTINSSMGNHLNFALLKNNKKVDPLDYYSKIIKDI